MINSYSIKKKLTVIKIAQNIGVKMTHLRTGIPLSNIYRWMSRFSDYSTIRNPSRVRRVGYKGTTMLSITDELYILEWIHDRNLKDFAVSHSIVSLYCRTSIMTTDCKYSTGWFLDS